MRCFSIPNDTSLHSASCVYVGRNIEYGTLRSFPEELLAPDNHSQSPTYISTAVVLCVNNMM